jgi:hypothetical protein
MFSFLNPSENANKYLKKIPSLVSDQLSPYINAGNNQISALEKQYSQLMQTPGQMLNSIGQSYQQSPGFNFALQQALQGANHAAAAGGMAGSPQHQYQNMQIGTNLANQDYNDWLQKALGLYGTGISGSQDMYHTGYNASDSLARYLKDTLESQASNAFSGKSSLNSMLLGTLGSYLGLGSNMGTLNPMKWF